MEQMNQEQNPYLTTIAKSKTRFYPKLTNQVLEFSIFDISMRKIKGKKLFYIGVKILGEHELFMIQIKNLNISEM